MFLKKDDSAHQGHYPLDIASNKAANGPLEHGGAAGDLPPTAPHNSMYTVNPMYIVEGNLDEDEDFESVCVSLLSTCGSRTVLCCPWSCVQ